MKTDLYTKIVLTVIAAALVALVCRDYSVPVQAAEQQRLNVNIDSVAGVKLNFNDVGLTDSALPVRIMK